MNHDSHQKTVPTTKTVTLHVSVTTAAACVMPEWVGIPNLFEKASTEMAPTNGLLYKAKLQVSANIGVISGVSGATNNMELLAVIYLVVLAIQIIVV